MDVGKIYGIGYVPDRRQVQVPVGVERRSGVDRRKSPRLALNSKIKEDFYAAKNLFTSPLQNDVFQSSITKNETSIPSLHLKTASLVKKPTLTSFVKNVLGKTSIPVIDVAGILDGNTHKEKSVSFVKSACRVSGAGLGAVAAYTLFPLSMSSFTPLIATGVAFGITGAYLGNNVAKFINKNFYIELKNETSTLTKPTSR